MKEGIFLSLKELNRFEVIAKAVQGHLSTREASIILCLSERQTRRLKAKFREKGLKGLVHGNRGRSPANKIPSFLKEKVLSLLKGKYEGFNTLHLKDKLEEEEGIRISRETIRSLYIENGIPRRKHKRKRRFTLRERMPQRGLMLQMDSSDHDWFSGGDDSVLIAAIDGATNEVPFASFFTSDNTLNNMVVLKEIIKEKGLFKSLYVDNASHFKTIRKGGTHVVVKTEDFKDTQIERALDELGIEMINAHTPQAKGRIERLFQLFQDRLLKELRLREIREINQANQFLSSYWLPYHNKKFSFKPRQEGSAYLPLPGGVDLDSIFCLKFERRVNYDNTISFNKRIFEILPDSYRICFAKAVVEVRQLTNGRIKIFYQGRALKFTERTESLCK